ncbi:MAG TPA: RNA polymerase sigma factor, partial [Jatrophihabitans sp.]|nr:RNA polymerase sigma factor [Jatrophihabitans sp.]
ETPAGTEADVRAALDQAHRREWAGVLAAAVRLAGGSGGIALAEDCVQDAFVSALQAWQRDGIPRNPGAWLTTAARRRVLDALRRSRSLDGKLAELARSMPGGGESPAADDGFGDDRLRLIFTCCHPALAREAQVALTLRLVCGLSTADIARLFLVSEPTMAARVTRAKKKIAAAGIPYRVPAPAELADRLDAVLMVIHLVFSTGYAAPSGDLLVRPELVERAIELDRLLIELMPDEREAQGLLALMLMIDARRASRADPAGDLVLLAEQDRSCWDRALIAEGDRVLRSALRGGRPGRFLLQAAIAAVHSHAERYADTDWAQIVGLYDLLWQRWPSPVVQLNRAVAIAMADGPAAGLAELASIPDEALAGYHYLPAVRADLLRRLGRFDEAASQYRDALALAGNAAERRFLQRRLAEVGG